MLYLRLVACLPYPSHSLRSPLSFDPLQQSFCTNLLSWYKSTPVLQYQEKNYKYVLYKIERK